MSRPQAIEVVGGGLKCDAAGCGFRCEEIRTDEYELFVDTACPLCGANLLTKEDLKAFRKVEAIVAFANRWFWWLPKTKNPKSYGVDFNGTGRAFVSEKKR